MATLLKVAECGGRFTEKNLSRRTQSARRIENRTGGLHIPLPCIARFLLCVSRSPLRPCSVPRPDRVFVSNRHRPLIPPQSSIAADLALPPAGHGYPGSHLAAAFVRGPRPGPSLFDVPKTRSGWPRHPKSLYFQSHGMATRSSMLLSLCIIFIRTIKCNMKQVYLCRTTILCILYLPIWQ
jgi:hypothetical protein